MKHKSKLSIVLAIMLIFVVSGVAFAASHIPWATATFVPNSGRFFAYSNGAGVENIRWTTSQISYFVQRHFGDGLEFEFRPQYTNKTVSAPDQCWNTRYSTEHNFPAKSYAYFEFETSSNKSPDDISCGVQDACEMNASTGYYARFILTPLANPSTPLTSKRFQFEVEKGAYWDVLNDALPIEYSIYGGTSWQNTFTSTPTLWQK